MKKRNAVGIIIIVVSLLAPILVSNAAAWFAGPAEHSVSADNLSGTYYFDNGSGEQTSSVSLSADNGSFLVTVPDENAQDTDSDRVELTLNEPTPATIIDSNLIELYSEIVTGVEYDNLTFKVQYDGSNGTITLEEDTISGTEFTNLEEITLDYAYNIQSTAGENADPVLILESPSGDNQTLANATLDPVKHWGYEDESTVSLGHSGTYAALMLIFGIGCAVIAVFSTEWLNIKSN